jgi:hypothetical protein
MSALGQKQIYVVQQPMSALLPTAKADIRLAELGGRIGETLGDHSCSTAD